MHRELVPAGIKVTSFPFNDSGFSAIPGARSATIGPSAGKGKVTRHLVSFIAWRGKKNAAIFALWISRRYHTERTDGRTDLCTPAVDRDLAARQALLVRTVPGWPPVVLDRSGVGPPVRACGGSGRHRHEPDSQKQANHGGGRDGAVQRNPFTRDLGWPNPPSRLPGTPVQLPHPGDPLLWHPRGTA